MRGSNPRYIRTWHFRSSVRYLTSRKLFYDRNTVRGRHEANGMHTIGGSYQLGAFNFDANQAAQNGMIPGNKSAAHRALWPKWDPLETTVHNASVRSPPCFIRSNQKRKKERKRNMTGRATKSILNEQHLARPRNGIYLQSNTTWGGLHHRTNTGTSFPRNESGEDWSVI